MQHGLPLDEARRRDIEYRVFLQIDRLPRTPVAVGIVHVAAAGKELDIARAAEFGASPAGEDFGVEHIALVAAFGFRRPAQQKHFAQIAGGDIKSARRELRRKP